MAVEAMDKAALELEAVLFLLDRPFCQPKSGVALTRRATHLSRSLSRASLPDSRYM